MDTKQSVLFVASEVEGIIKSGGLADVAKSLPEALLKLNYDVRIAMPAYHKIAGLQDAEVLLETALDAVPYTPYRVLKLEVAGIDVFAIDCPQYFGRAEMYAENNQAYRDNGERFSFFSAASLDMLPKLGFQPDVVHANDWHTGFVPFLLKYRYSKQCFYREMKSVLTIHNAVFQGVFSYDELGEIPEFANRWSPEAAVSETHVSMLRAGVLTAHKVNAVSPTYAHELQTELGSHGMAYEFQSREADLHGILNGCDYGAWNPEVDEYLPKTYKANQQSMARGKKACRIELQKQLGLPQEEVAVYGMVCRLTHQKGVHYLLPILDRFLKNDLQMVIVGTGDPKLAVQLHHIAERYPEKFVFVEAYNNQLAHLVEAASDFFVMPSEFEPCGLNQIYSMAYGTLPIVRAVGGLKDSVADYDTDPESATGFVYESPDPEALLTVMQRSLLLYCQNRKEVKRVQLHAMKQTFCWDDAADKYHEMYQLMFV
ncbi:glycogen synthase GlgA [Vibrio maerlii]|uniref:glycogen synthase GlgA n=1 Tax=Vibrio maerlii TaxID=2231648 RepID=UPI000E3B6FE9|nr:glycogen synthase GlgA [Vibrio maerlii]